MNRMIEQTIQQIESALLENNDNYLEELLVNLNPSNFNEAQTHQLLKNIRGSRKFDLLERTAGLFSAINPNDIQTSRQYAQALIEQNRLKSAITVLGSRKNQNIENLEEHAEIIGLLGRCFKQQYVEKGNGSDLKLAMDNYREGWNKRDGDYRWHGINLAALNHLAIIDQTGLGNEVEKNDTAAIIIGEIESLENDSNLTVWDIATAFEANIALRNNTEAEKWLKRYLSHPDINAFELGSTLRQMKEIWRLGNDPENKDLLPILEGALIGQPNSTLEINKDTCQISSSSTRFEAIYGEDGIVHYRWFESMKRKMLAVARLSNKETGSPEGTGFVIDGGKLHNDWNGSYFLATNAHVVSSDIADEATLSPENVIAEFTLMDNLEISLGKQMYHSNRWLLDTSIYQIQLPEELEALEPYPHLPVDPKESTQPSAKRIYVLGYPGGKDMHVSLYGNELVNIDLPHLHYRSPTEGGNSGSPLFNYEWKLLGIHHAAKDDLKVNEGIAFEPIKEDINNTL